MRDRPNGPGWWLIPSTNDIWGQVVHVYYDAVKGCDCFHLHFAWPMVPGSEEYKISQPMERWDVLMKGHKVVRLVREDLGVLQNDKEG